MEKRFRKIGLFIGALILIAMSSCNNHDDIYDYYAHLNQDVATIDSYLAANNISAVKDILGIRMVVTNMGTGLPAMLYDTINVDYVGKLFSDNSTFDSSTGATIPLPNVIDGWKAAFLTLPAGSTATLYIPSPLGYADRDLDKVPANSILVFNVTFNYVKSYNAKVKQFTTDTTAIRKYIMDNKITDVIKDPTGVFYKFTAGGNGPTPSSLYDKVTINYGVTLMGSGTSVFSNVTREPDDQSDSRVVDYFHGLKIGLMKMPVGSKATLYVPSGLGYGATNTYDGSNNLAVPANSNIIVDIELKDIDN